MDLSVKPGDDFYKFVNGQWDAKTEIPADRSSWGGFAVLRDLSDQRTRAIIEDSAKQNAPAGTVAQKVGDFYASFMDEAAIEARGMDPVKPMLAKIDGLTSRDDLARALAENVKLGLGSPVEIGVELDLKDNSKYGVYVGQGGLGMPNRDYYLVDNDRFKATRVKYKTYIAETLKLAGFANAEARAEAIYALEEKIAKGHWTSAESRQIDKLYNPVATAALDKDYAGLGWSTYLQTAGLAGQPQVIVTQPSAIKAALALVANEPMDVWKDYLRFHTVKAASPMLSKAFVDLNFGWAQTLSGTPKLKDRWKRGVDLVNGTMGEAVGEIYVARYFPPEAKAKADELVRNLIKAMDARLANLAWMAPETKVKARAKLAAFTPKIGYPSKWRDYSALKVERGDLWGNVMRATEFEYQRQLGKIGKPVDRSEWFMTPQTVNAYANPLMNEIVFPAAILQPPFFDPKADDAVNYGAIGAVIGHEISHHFDDQGRKFDMNGNLSDWWTKEDVARFDALAKRVVDQYGSYEPLPGKKVNGELTLGENIADLAGVTIAYDAYKMSLKGKKATKLGGYMPDQRFFLGFGQVWRNKYREPVLLQQLTTDPHTPGHFRPYVVRNIDAWYSSFGVKPGEKFYLKPEDRAHIW
ncbi:MAG: M13 family peptidase [Sphingomonadaceae bacterium]|nr:M13 family peptidase [Sphingomonadaceae bacterium]NBU78898.1 M13 family peptidase [Sphingomonadaceae bacterium]